MATGTTRRTALNTIAKEGLFWPKINDSDTLSADLHAIARALENDVEGGAGKLSARPAPALRGRLFYVEEGSEKGLYWDTGGAWIPIGTAIETGQIKEHAVTPAQLALEATQRAPLHTVTSAVSVAALNGQMVEATSNITVTSPAGATDAAFSILANNHAVKVKAATGEFYGDFIEKAKEITFVGYQHGAFQWDGANWFITSGEPRREGSYGALTTRAPATVFEPSATRPVEVILSTLCIGSTAGKVLCGGIEIYSFGTSANGSPSITFKTYPGEKWEWTKGEGSITMFSTYRVL